MKRAAQACRHKELSVVNRRLLIESDAHLDRQREALERRREIRRVSSRRLPRLQEVLFVDKGTLRLEHFEEDADEICYRDSQRQFRCGVW